MTLDDAREWCKQADEIGWKRFQPTKENARIILIGGEPTVHPDFMEFVQLAMEWSGAYVQVYSNGWSAQTRALLEHARIHHSASIERSNAKPRGSVTGPEWAGWRLDMYVSPADAGVPSPPCYVHPSEICGLGIDHEGYSMCPIGASVRALLGLPRTRRFADLFDIDLAARMTAEECSHCGYEYAKRAASNEHKERFAAYVAQCPTMQGCLMSPTWQSVFQGREVKK
ncbi:MAG: hypothetical protein V2A73_15985 [Pseudomonadota bacterium]